VNDDRRVEAQRLLGRLGIDEDVDVATLSGGSKRRVLLARELSSGADVLLLDEPTNHLDIETVLWLEDYLLRGAPTRSGSGRPPAVVFVTHDRAFARRLATRVAEIDRGTLFAFSCGYGEFLKRRDELLAAEAEARAKFDKKLAKEEAWLQRGVKARRTRDEGRVKALMDMRRAYEARRSRQGSVAMGINAATRSGNLVAQTKHLSFGFDDSNLIEDLSTTILRGDRVGIVGPNGAGKTTLVRLLVGQLTPTSGTVRLGVGLEVVYLDQMRSLLDMERTVADNLGDGYDTITSNGKTVHINAYLQDFLFDENDAAKPVSILSGGERSRLLLAKLFAQPSNLLVLDEPTNDLDIDTLDVLERCLNEYAGTILLVSHDRELLDNVVTECLVLPGDGRVVEYVGGYADWRDREARRKDAERGARREEQRRVPTDTAAKSAAWNGRAGNRPRKLTFKEARELERIPERIADLEAERAAIHEALADAGIYRSNPGLVKDHTGRLAEIEKALETAYQRWEELEELAAKSS
jgi:ATP-binding cassette subfamily F protein uup